MKFIIREDQFSSISARLEEESDRKLALYLRNRFSTMRNMLVDKDTIEIILKVRKTALVYEVTREDNIATFLDLTIMYGEYFHLDPWANNILQCKLLHGPDKMALLRHYVKETGVNI